MGLCNSFRKWNYRRLMDTKVCLVAWKYASLAIQFAVRRIKTFNGICGVNYHSDFICNLQSLVHTPVFCPHPPLHGQLLLVFSVNKFTRLTNFMALFIFYNWFSNSRARLIALLTWSHKCVIHNNLSSLIWTGTYD